MLGGVLEDRRLDLQFEVWADHELTNEELKRNFRAWVQVQDPRQSFAGARVRVRAIPEHGPELAFGD